MKYRPRVYARMRSFERVRHIAEEECLAAYDTGGLSASLLTRWREEIERYGLSVRSLSTSAVARLLGERPPAGRGRTLLINGRFRDFLAYHRGRQVYQRIPGVNQRLTRDLRIQKMKTNLKVGTHLARLQQYLGVRPQKGFVQIVEAKTLAAVGECVTPGVREVCTTLKRTMPFSFSPLWLRVRGEPLDTRVLNVIQQHPRESAARAAVAARISIMKAAHEF